MSWLGGLRQNRGAAAKTDSQKVKHLLNLKPNGRLRQFIDASGLEVPGANKIVDQSGYTRKSYL